MSRREPSIYQPISRWLIHYAFEVSRTIFNIFHSFISGFKETSFAYAISAAGVTHQVSKACSMGKLKSCGCDMSVYGLSRTRPNAYTQQKNFEWGGCSHNVDFGEQYARKFLDSKEIARDIHSQINLHNNKAGRLVSCK